MKRAIIHLNVANFAVAVERTLSPRIQDRPVIIAPPGAARATVYDMSQEAYLGGVRKGMALQTALSRCRDAEVIPPRIDRYARAMGALLTCARPYSPLIEHGETDGHLFLDVSGTRRLLGTPIDVAWRLQRQVKADMQLSPIWSVAPNKLVAKVATRVVKPRGDYVVGEGEEATFLAPLPLSLLPGIEPGELKQLWSLNLTTTVQVRALTPDELEIPFGNRSGFIHDTVRGIDSSPVRPPTQAPLRVIRAHTFDTDTNAPRIIDGALYALTEKAGQRLRQRRLATRRIGVFLDYADGLQQVRSATVRPASANDITLFDRARIALASSWRRRVRVRHLRVVCDRLTFPPAQLALFTAEREAEKKRTALMATLDAVRARFGPDALQVGRTLR